jgi:short-subunit dehydrogenase
VTGCTAGIGEEITYKLAEDGFNIVLVGRSVEKVQRVQDEVNRRSGGKVKTIPVIADLCKKAMDIEFYQSMA